MNSYESLRGEPKEIKTARTRQRLLPSQPEGTDPDKVYVGSDIGSVAYSGEKPLSGDMVTVVGQSAQQVVLSPQTAGLSMPLFGNSCRCKCTAGTGTIAWACPIHTGPYIVIMDGNGTIRQVPQLGQIGRIAGLAIDANPPNNLYVLDDRTHLNNFVTDSSPNAQIAGVSTYALHTFQLSGTTYVWSSIVEMSDPGLPTSPFFVDELQWVTNGPPSGLTDPPATYPTNCMSVINGLLYITMSARPAHYLVWNGSSFTTHNLSLNGADYNKGLRGAIQSGIDKPGAKSNFYVIAWEGFSGRSDIANPTFYPLGYEIVAFDATDNVLQHFSDTSELLSPTALMVICNRVFVLQSPVFGRTEPGGAGDLNGTQINNSFGTTIPNSLMLFDLCRSPKLVRATKQYNLPLDIQGRIIQPTTVAALGCQPVISGVQQTSDKVVLSRNQQRTGAFQSALLTASDGADREQPGPTSQLATAPGLALSSSVPNPFPVVPGSFGATYTFGSDEWFEQFSGGFSLLHSDGHEFKGFGAAQAPYWTLDLPPGRVFAGVPTGRLENHTYDDYLLMPVVSSTTEPLTLGFNSANNDYEWSFRSGLVQLVTNQVGGGGSGQQWTMNMFWTEVHPALLRSSGPTLSGVLAGDSSNNGAGLNRSYCYLPLASGLVAPDFNGSASASYSVASGSLRDALILYSWNDGGITQPSSFNLTVEGILVSPVSASLPTPQKNPFGVGPNPLNLNQASSYSIPTLTVQTESGSGRQFVGLAVSLTIPGGFSQTAQIEFVQDPLVPLADWLATPRYYEILAFFVLTTGLL